MNEQVSCFGLFVCSLWPCRHIGLKYKRYCSQWTLMRSGDVRQLQWDDGIGEFFCKHGCNLRMNESIFPADTKRLLRYKNIPNFLQTCKLHWLLYDYNLNVWMCFSASKCNLILTKRERAGSFSSSNMHKSMKCMKLSLLLFVRRLGGTRVSVSSFSCLKHQDTLIFLPCPVFSTASFCKTNLPKNSPINTKFKYLCLFVSLLLCRLTEKWDDEFRGKRSRVPLCVSEMWRNVLQVWTYSHQTLTASLCLSSVYSI